MNTQSYRQPRCIVAAVLWILIMLLPAGNAAVIATWGSTVDNGRLEGVDSLFAMTSDSTKGTNIGGNLGTHDHIFSDPSSALRIPGGQITYKALGLSRELQKHYGFSFTVAGLDPGQFLNLDGFDYSTWVNGGSGGRGWRRSALAWTSDGSDPAIADIMTGNHASVFEALSTFSTTSGLPSGLQNGDEVNFRIFVWAGVDHPTAGDNLESTRLGAIAISGTAVPEPSTTALAIIAALGILFGTRAQRKRNT